MREKCFLFLTGADRDIRQPFQRYLHRAFARFRLFHHKIHEIL